MHREPAALKVMLPPLLTMYAFHYWRNISDPMEAFIELVWDGLGIQTCVTESAPEIIYALRGIVSGHLPSLISL